MSWLDLSVTLTEGGKRLEQLQQLLKARQVERELINAEALRATTEQLDPSTGSDPSRRKKRIEPTAVFIKRDVCSLFEFRPTRINGNFIMTGPGLGSGLVLPVVLSGGMTVDIANNAFKVNYDGTRDFVLVSLADGSPCSESDRKLSGPSEGYDCDRQFSEVTGGPSGISLFSSETEALPDFGQFFNSRATLDAWLSFSVVDTDRSLATFYGWRSSTTGNSARVEVLQFPRPDPLVLVRVLYENLGATWTPFSGICSFAGPDTEFHLRVVFDDDSIQVALNGSYIPEGTEEALAGFPNAATYFGAKDLFGPDAAWDFSSLDQFTCVTRVTRKGPLQDPLSLDPFYLPNSASIRLVRLYSCALPFDNFTPPQS
jgi:hypothetical protein